VRKKADPPRLRIRLHTDEWNDYAAGRIECDLVYPADGLRLSRWLQPLTAGGKLAPATGGCGVYRGRSPAGTDCTQSNVSPSATVNIALAILRLSFFIALIVVVDLGPGELRRTLAPRGVCELSHGARLHQQFSVTELSHNVGQVTAVSTRQFPSC
jgi:hypothetical protein